MVPRSLTDGEKAAIKSSYSTSSKAIEAILSTWSYSDLREVIENHFWRDEDWIKFIMQEGLVDDEIDDFLDFEAYPEHYEALVKAGIIKDVAPPPPPTVSAADMEGQPKLLEDALRLLVPPIPAEYDDPMDRMIYAHGRADAWNKARYIVGFEMIVVIAVILMRAVRC